MFIVTKLDILKKTVDIIKIVDDDSNISKMTAYDALINDALQYNDCSIKNVSISRVEIHERGILSNYLRFIYELHEDCENEEEEESEKDNK